MAIGRIASLAAKAAKKALQTRRKSLGTIRRSRADRRVESAGVTRNLPRSTALARTAGTKLATTGGTLARTAGTRVGTARPMRNVTPRANSKLRGALTDAAAVAGVAGIIGGAIYGGGNKPKKTTPVVPSAKKKPSKPSTPSRHTSKIPKPPAGLKKATRPKAKKAPVKKAAKRMTSVPTVRNRRGIDMGSKTQVEVGSSIIRNRDGSIKKINKPTGVKKKSKYASMSKMQIAKLGGIEKRNYKKWKASQGK
jgi:hypothetical protein